MLTDRQILVREEKRKVVVRDNGSVRIIEIARQGPPGAVGATGPQGPAGLSGLDDFDQSFASGLTWTVNHNLGRFPIVTILTTGNVEMDAQIVHTNNNQFVVHFAAPMAGSVRCV